MSTKLTRTRKTRTEIISRIYYRSATHLACARLRHLATSRRNAPFFVVVLLGCFAAASAQTASHKAKAPKRAQDYAVVFGTAWDSDGRPVYGVHVHLRRVGDEKPRWEAYSDHHGEFAFHVPAGKSDYELTGDLKSGKFPQTIGLPPKEPVAVHVDSNERVDVGLHLTKQ